MKAAPPGWKPDQIMSRIDGWVVPGDEDRIPAAVAAMLARAMPSLGDGSPIADIRARMIARQRAHDRMQAFRHEQQFPTARRLRRVFSWRGAWLVGEGGQLVPSGELAAGVQR